MSCNCGGRTRIDLAAFSMPLKPATSSKPEKEAEKKIREKAKKKK